MIETPLPDDFYQDGFPLLNAFLRSSVFFCIPYGGMVLLCGGAALGDLSAVATFCFLGGFLIAIYGLWLCWRLYLDSLLFLALAKKNMSELALDQGLAWFMQRPVNQKTLPQRWRGTRSLYKRLLISLPATLCAFCAGVLYS